MNAIPASTKQRDSHNKKWDASLSNSLVVTRDWWLILFSKLQLFLKLAKHTNKKILKF
jgi:hypothetical protein